jgi:hypothetical protein
MASMEVFMMVLRCIPVKTGIDFEEKGVCFVYHSVLSMLTSIRDTMLNSATLNGTEYSVNFIFLAMQ